MDTWESFFREKSRRRANAAAARSLRSMLGWALAAVAFLALVVALLALIGV